MGIEVRNLDKRFGSFHAVDDVSLRVEPGKLVALLGPSGSGKSTILRMIAGLETPDSGCVLMNDADCTALPVQKRNVGFVFQHYALFKHLTVFENVAFGLRVRSWRKLELRERVMRLLKLVQLDHLALRYPSQLSGGQRQRVALARALAPEPAVLLLDEPFGALDAQVRVELREWLRRLHDEVHVTSIFVTHDQEEALEISDQIAILNQGRLEQFGSPREIWEQPASPFVMSFIGPVNRVLGAVGAQLAALMNGAVVREGDETALIRPNELDVVPTAAPSRNAITPTSSLDSLAGRVDRVRYLGSIIKLEVEMPDSQRVQVHLPRERFEQLKLAMNDWVQLRPKHPRE